MPYRTLQPFKFGKKESRIWSFTGRILGSSKRSETTVYHHSASSYVSPTTGTIQYTPSSTSSSTVVKQEFFVRDDEGKEVPYQLSGVDIPVHDGQAVTMISVEQVGGKWHWFARLVNLDTQRSYTVTDVSPSKLGLVRSRGSVIKRTLLLVIGGGFILAPLLGYAGLSSVGVGGLALLFFLAAIVYLPRGWRRYGRASDQLYTLLDAQSSQALSAVRPAPIAQRPVEIVEREVLKIPCKFCGNLIDPVRDTKCPSCGATITLGREIRAPNAQPQEAAVDSSSSRFCSSCGAKVSAGAAFCPKCGGRLGS